MACNSFFDIISLCLKITTQVQGARIIGIVAFGEIFRRMSKGHPFYLFVETSITYKKM